MPKGKTNQPPMTPDQYRDTVFKSIIRGLRQKGCPHSCGMCPQYREVVEWLKEKLTNL